MVTIIPHAIGICHIGIVQSPNKDPPQGSGGHHHQVTTPKSCQQGYFCPLLSLHNKKLTKHTLQPNKHFSDYTAKKTKMAFVCADTHTPIITKIFF